MTDQYAVIGNPISHSKSPAIHAFFAAQTGQDMSYVAIESPLDGFKATVMRLKSEGFKGCNVTVPFKFEAFQLCEGQTTVRAREAGAVNTLMFEGEKILGDNTDGEGLVTDIEQNLGFDLVDKKVLLVGAGGAAHGVVFELLKRRCMIMVTNRTMEKARQMEKDFSSFGEISAQFIEALPEIFNVVINATSSGLSNESLPLPHKLFAPHALAYDMMYGKETPFMKFAKSEGVEKISDGLGMLVEQAAAAFFIWRGVRPETAPVLAKLRAS